VKLETLSQIKFSHPDCYHALLNLSSFLYKEDSSVITIPERCNVDLLQPAVQANLINVNNKEVAIIDDLIRQEILIQYVMDEVLLKAWEQQGQLSAVVKEIYLKSLRSFNLSDTLAIRAIVLLHNTYKKDVVERLIIEVVGDGANIQDFFNVVTEALPYLEVKVEILENFLHEIQNASTQNFYTGSVFIALEKLSINQPSTAKTLYQSIVSEPKLSLADFICCLLVGLSKIDFDFAYYQAHALSCDELAVLIRQGVAVLGLLDYKPPERCFQLQNTLNRYEKLLNHPDIDIIAAVTKSYGILIQYNSVIGESIVKLSRRTEPQIQGQILYTLQMNKRERSKEPWFENSLLNLASIDFRHTQLVEGLKWVLYSLIEKRAKLAIAFFELWIENHDYGFGANQGDLTELFELVISEMQMINFQLLLDTITRWFNHDESKFHIAASHLVNQISRIFSAEDPPRASSTELCLSKSVLDTLSLKDTKFTIIKILGNVVNSKALCSLVFSCLQREPNDNEVNSLVVSAFNDYIAYNYLGEATDFLKERIENGSELEIKVAKSILEAVELYYQPLKDLPPLRELELSPTQIQQLRLAESKNSNKLWEESGKRSVFMSLVKRVPLKAGKTWSADGDLTQKFPLKEFTFSYEVPRGEYIDPVGQEIRRRNYRLIKRESLG